VASHRRVDRTCCRSLTAALVVGGWFAAFVVTKATYPYASVDDASAFRVMMPAYPAFILLLASLVYLFPGRHRARFEAAQPSRPRAHGRRRLALLGSGAAVFALYPLALVAVASPVQGPRPPAYEAFGLLRSIDPTLRLAATVTGQRVQLTWNAAGRDGVFYRIWRSSAPTGGATCTGPARGRELPARDGRSRRTSRWTFVDKPGHGRFTYRLGLAASWLNSPLYGDIFSLGPPLVVRAH
jgi:hypothetical protein